MLEAFTIVHQTYVNATKALRLNLGYLKQGIRFIKATKRNNDLSNRKILLQITLAT